jgi:hypothetical protein
MIIMARAIELTRIKRKLAFKDELFRLSTCESHSGPFDDAMLFRPVGLSEPGLLNFNPAVKHWALSGSARGGRSWNIMTIAQRFNAGNCSRKK